MHFLPHFPLHPSLFTLFGLILLLGLIGGEIARYSRFLPIITGYIAIGIIVGPGGFNIIDQSSLTNARLFFYIPLGLILFDLGKHLDFTWLRHDRGLLPMSIAESSISFALVFAILILVGMPWLPAAMAATIVMMTSPAVIMLVAHDLSAEGPVTRRSLILTSLNNLYGLTLFTILLPLTQIMAPSSQIKIHIFYRLFGSLLLGLGMFILTSGIAYLIGKRKENQFVLLIGIVVLTTSLAQALNISPMLSLFTLGVAARNFDYKHILIEVDFGWLGRIFLITLFVATGIFLHLKGLWQSTGIIIAILLVRSLGKFFGIWLLANKSRLTKQQTGAISLALMPMAGVAIGMSNTLIDFNPELGFQLNTIITAVVAILQLLGPIAAQFAFIKSGETLPEST